jgi:hypothetical protein
MKEERQNVTCDEDLRDPFVSYESVTLGTSPNDEASECHVYRRCEQCLWKKSWSAPQGGIGGDREMNYRRN